MAASDKSTQPSPTAMTQIHASASQLWSSMTSPRDKQGNGGVQTTAESVLRVMFGACTSGSAVADDEEDMLSPNSSRERSTSTCEPNDPDTLYPRSHSEKKALSAVERLQELRLSSLAEKRTSSSSNVPGPFPASSPQHKMTKPQSSDSPLFEDVGARDNSFDDGVSAISAHTLEEMALAYEAMDGFSRIRSDLTQDPAMKAEESWKQVVTRRGGTLRQPGMSPIRFGRDGRSSNTRYSCQTKSTVSTQTQEFATFFQKDEANYWSEIVKEDGRTSSFEKPGDFLKLTRDGTITTVPSSSCSGVHTPSRYRRQASDTDRLLDVLVVPPGTEIGEI